MTAAIFGLIGAFIGGLFGYLGTKHSSNTQLEIAKSGNEHLLHLDNIKAERELRERELIRLRGQFERAHRILSLIGMENSQTVSFIESTGDLDIEAFNSRYLDNCKVVDELRAIAVIDIPELIIDCEDIYSLSNRFWGNQSWKMEHLKNDSSDGAMAVSKDLYEAIYAMPDSIRSAKDIIRNQSEILSKKLNSLEEY